MIQRVITYRCTKCISIEIVKNGTDYKGKQKFHCLDCSAYGILEPQSRSYPEVIKEYVLCAYQERASTRGVERIFGIARQTLARWITENADALPDLADTVEAPKANDVLELDELWSYVFRKSDKRWIWIALRNEDHIRPESSPPESALNFWFNTILVPKSPHSSSSGLFHWRPQ